jgi:murein L,D-transpeptidase YafK
MAMKRTRIAPLLLAWAVPALLACQCGSAPPEAPAAVAEQRDSASLQALLDTFVARPAEVSFRVDKSERRFSVLAGGAVVKSYPCVLGEVPEGDKRHQGDRRTPEGVFGIRGKRVHDRWHRFIWLDYPNAESWRRYRERKAKGLIPAGRDIGGEIGIHGVPEGMDHWITAGADWTWGCIALRNADVDEIYPWIIPGRTLIEVVP